MRHSSICLRPCLAFLQAHDGLSREELAAVIGRHSRDVGGMLRDLELNGIIGRIALRRTNQCGTLVSVWGITAKGRKIANAILDQKIEQMNGQRSLKAKPRTRNAANLRSSRSAGSRSETDINPLRERLADHGAPALLRQPRKSLKQKGK